MEYPQLILLADVDIFAALLYIAWDVAYFYTLCSVVFRLARLLDWTVGPAKSAEPIRVMFGMWTLVGSGNHVLDGDSHPPQWMGQFWGDAVCC